MKKYAAFNYNMAFIILLIILMFGVFEWLSANLKIAVILTVPLLPTIFLFKNTYDIKKDRLTVSTFKKVHQTIWLRDVEKIEIGKTLFGKAMVKVFYNPYDYLSLKLGKDSVRFVAELEARLEELKQKA